MPLESTERCAGCAPSIASAKSRLAEGSIVRPWSARRVASLYDVAADVASGLGWNLGEAAVGGGSDGNFTAGLGIPTLDGLGGVGDGAHAVHEHIVISELPKQAALLAGLIERV